MTENTDAHEELEQAEHAAHVAAELGLAIPLSITVMAVIAAVFGSLETTAASTAVLARSDAAVRQGEASDLWGFFQARSLKKNMYELAAEEAAQLPPDRIAALKDKAATYAKEEEGLQAAARAKEEEVRRQEAASEAAMECHHRFAIATNIVHLAIAVASVSILVRRRWLWYGALAVTAAGVVAAFV
jgi:hypothetical protein